MASQLGLAKLQEDTRAVVVVRDWPRAQDLDRFGTRWYLGGLAYTTNDLRVVIDSAYREVQGMPTHAGLIARSYLAEKYPKKLRVDSRTYEGLFLHEKRKAFAPYYAAAGWSGEAIYFDLKAAYMQILLAAGWDVEYNPNRWLGVRSSNEDVWFKDDKLARNILVSTARPSKILVYSKGKTFYQSGGGKHINLVLYSFVMDVLHGVALDMVQRVGAVYVATDGYIVPAEREQDARDVFHDWALNWGVKHMGLAQIFGASDYAFPDKPRRRHGVMVSHNNLTCLSDLSWLRKNYACLVDKERRFKL